MVDLPGIWDRFAENKKIWENKWIDLIPWIIGLDVLIIGANFSFILELQKQHVIIRYIAGFGWIFIWISFVMGIYFKHKEVELSGLKTNEIGKEYLKEIDMARSLNGQVPQEAARSAEEWAKAIKAYTGSAEALQRYGNICIHFAFWGLILIACSCIGIIFFTEFSRCCPNWRIETPIQVLANPKVVKDLPRKKLP